LEIALLTSYVLLDRDGTLIKHVPYLANPDLVELLPNVAEGLRYLSDLGYFFGVITNQSVIGRNLATRTAVDSVNNKVLDLLAQQGVNIAFVLMCPHTPEDPCECRKPLPQLGLKAIDQYGIDARSSYMIGDMDLDIEFGKAIGVRTIKITNENHSESQSDCATIDLLSAAKYIHSQVNRD